MYQSADSDASVDVKVKDELNIGPTVLLQSLQNGLENQINGGCTIKLEHDTDEGTRKLKDCFKFETQEALEEIDFKKEPDYLDYEDVEPVIAAQSPIYQVGYAQIPVERQQPGRTTVGNPGGDSLFSGPLADAGSCNNADHPSTSKHAGACTDAKQFSCKICSARFKYVSVLKIHERKHSNEKSIECERCNKSFTSLGDLKSHICTGTHKKSYDCEICNRSFTCLNVLEYHKHGHTVEKPYQCKICNESFITVGRLNSHIRTHAVEKTYNCEICNKSFALWSELNSHKYMHKKVVIPYHCDICNISFKQLSHFESHIESHIAEELYHCQICNESFTTMADLVQHSGIFQSHTHIAEELYNCEICNQSFTTMADLVQHSSIHVAQNKFNKITSTNNLSSLESHNIIFVEEGLPHNCEKCNISYNRLSDFTRHNRSKHFSDIRKGLQFYPYLRNINKDMIP